MSKNKLLLADDSITIQKVVNLTFADEGIEVVAVGDGDTALEKIQESAPDLIMADVNMPGLSGYQICEMVKQNPQLREIPVILLVGSFEPFDEEEARRVGADDFMTKPFQSIRQLVVKVTELLERKDKSSESDASQDFVDTLPDLNERMAAEKDFADTDDEMIQTAHYGDKNAETEKLSSDYLNRVSGFEVEQSYGNFQSDKGFSVENQNRFAEPAAQFDVEKTAYSDEPNASHSETEDTLETQNDNQSPAIYDFDDEKVEAKDFSKSFESEDESLENKSAENFAGGLNAEAEQTSDSPLNAAETEKISQPTSAVVLELDDLDFLELPPLENAVVQTGNARTAQPPKAAAPVENFADAVQTEIASTAANSENLSAMPQLSPEAIEAIAQRVVEKLSEKFFDKEA